MKKIALFTINGYVNYGNRLQNYASQKILSSFGFSCETILFSKEKFNTIGKLIKLAKIIKNGNLYQIIDRLKQMKDKKTISLRISRFVDFSKKFINEKDYGTINCENVTNLSDFDFYVVGGDQVWNITWYGNDKGIPNEYLLPFGEKKQRFSFSSSFGISKSEVLNMPHKLLKPYSKYISEMAFVSVRENEGADIIDALTRKKAEVLLDPTMLISRKDWLSIAKKPDWINEEEHFILTYFLGNITAEYKKIINNLANNSNFKIRHLNQVKYKQEYTTDPLEFLYLISKAKLVCTDSFHGAAISIIMQTPFLVFERRDKEKDMSSRLVNLLSKFNFEDRYIYSSSLDNIFYQGFDKSEKIIEREQEKAFNYLRKALGIKYGQ